MTVRIIKTILFYSIALMSVGCTEREIVHDPPRNTPPGIDAIMYPLDEYGIIQDFANVNVNFSNRFHAAEDVEADAGTPVYAIGNGFITHSGPMNGYGWLLYFSGWR